MYFKELTDEQQEKFIKEYYENGKVKDMLAELGVQENHIKICEQFRPEVLEQECEFCGTHLVRKRFPRNHLVSEEEKRKNTYCPNCNHNPFVDVCNCERCNEKPERKEEKLRNEIKAFWGQKPKKISMSKLSFRSRFYLDTICRFALTEDMMSTTPLSNIRKKIVPDKQYLYEIINDLIKNNILLVSEDSDLEAFVLSSDDFPRDFYYDKARYVLNVDEEYADEYASIVLSAPLYYSSDYAEEALEVWREISTYECIEYLRNELQLFGFEYQLGERTKMVFRSLLEVFSTAQVFAIIYDSISDVIRDLYLGKYKKREAGSTVLSYIKEFCNATERQKQNVGKYGCSREIPQSGISEYFFNKVLGLEYRGLYNSPNLEDLLMAKEK